MDRRRHHYCGSSLGRIPRPQKEALTPPYALAERIAEGEQVLAKPLSNSGSA